MHIPTEKVTYAERKATYKVALRKNGTDAQVMIAVEEMSELTKEICKMYRGKRPLDDLADEIADVLITMEQLQLIFDLGDLVDNRIAYKIQRLQKDLGMLEVSRNG